MSEIHDACPPAAAIPGDKALISQDKPPAAARGDVRGLPAGWTVEVDGEHVKVTKPDGAVSEWHKRPATNGSGMYDLCQALAAEGVQAGDVEQRARELLRLHAVGGKARTFLPDTDVVVKDGALRAIASALSQQPEARGVVDEDAAEALRFLLGRIGSWTYARWDQHLRHEFGDERATRMIATLTEARNVR